MTTVYRTPLNAPSRHETEPYQRGRPELDIQSRRVFVGSSDRGFYALRAEDGGVLWRFETLGVVQCEPLYDPQEDVVYFGSNDGALYKVRAVDGALLWRFATNAEVARRPVLLGSTVYAVNANDTVLALDRRTGQRKWSQHRTPALGMEVAGYAGPLVWRGLVYAGFSDGTVTAYDAATGVERWQPVDLSAEAEEALGDVPRYLDVDTTPVPSIIDESPVVFVGSYEGGVYALDADNGSKVWQRPEVTGVSELVAWQQPGRVSTAGPPQPTRSLLFASSGTTGLWALDPRTGEDVWHRPLPDGGVSAPVPIAGALLVSTTLHGLYLMSPIDGSVIDGIHTGAGFSMSPAAYGLRAFILSNSGALLSIHVTPPPT
jgi:outer membrane protein assembly factor BamB